MTATISPQAPAEPTAATDRDGDRRHPASGRLGVIAYFAWQYFGTNIVAKHKQDEIKKETRIQWDKGVDGDAIAMLRIKRFGDDYEVPIVKGFDEGALARGVGWDPKSAKPGEIGNFAIAGHRVTHGEPFSKFPKLKKGDLVSSRPAATSSPTSCATPAPRSPSRSRQRGHCGASRTPRPQPGADRATDHVAHVLGAVPHQQPQCRGRRARQDVRQEGRHDPTNG